METLADPVGPAERYTEYLPIDDVPEAPRNAKAHNRDKIVNSIRTFGFADIPVLDERTGRLVGGHGRLEALRWMRDAGEAPPEGIRTDGTTWLAPVVRGWASRSDADADALAIALNHLTEEGGWNNQVLAAILKDLSDQNADLVAAAGYDSTDLEELLADAAAAPIQGDPDDAPDLPDEADTITQPGQVWELGPHRLLVDDSTDTAAVEAFMGGDRADCMWTDPPYGVDYVGKTKDALTIRNDDAEGLPDLLEGAFATATAVLAPGAPVYVAHPPGPLSMDFARAFLDAGWLLRQNLVWVKDQMVLGHSDYHYQHEPILYGFVPGGEGRLGRGGERWYGDNAQVSVFEVPRPSRSEAHPNMKPVDLITAHLRNSCPRGGLVFDPFGGSGSTLIAAHTLRQAARLVELDPRYADVICRRWQEATGTLPRLDGAEHDFGDRG